MKKFVILVLFFALSSGLYADGTTQMGRYLTVRDGATGAQANPLQQTFSLTFPAQINTVGEAMTYILVNTGYQLVTYPYRTGVANLLFHKKLALADRSLGPITVEQALLALSGNAYQLVIDPKHQLVSFVMKPKFSMIYATYR